MITTNVTEPFQNYGKCLCISNGVIEAYVTIDIGPRIIRFGYVGGQNLMNTSREEMAPMNDEIFQNYFGKGKAWENLGGHRIWLSPESCPETYYPDMTPVSYTITENGAIFTSDAETENGVTKIMEIKMDADDANMQVIMRVQNIGNAPKEFSIWGLTVCEKTGTVVIKMNDNDTGLLSNRVISVWPYTDMSDERIHWGKKYVSVTQNPAAAGPLKLGFDLHTGTAYYILNDDILCKRHTTNHPNGKYPDNGCSFEAYTNPTIIEVESLSELKMVAPGEVSEHIESWSLCKKPCEVDFKSDDSIENLLENL